MMKDERGGKVITKFTTTSPEEGKEEKKREYGKKKQILPEYRKNC